MTVEEVLLQSGFTVDQIKALDQRAITSFSNVLSEAQQAREAAELAQRANVDFYEGRIAPALNNWSEEKSRMDAELAYHRAQTRSLIDNGVLSPDAQYQPRDGNGRYVANMPGTTPGSPTFDVNKVYERAGDAVGILTDIQWEHQRLFNAPLPISPTELVRRADAVKLDPRTYAAREFNWDARRQQMREEETKKHDDQIRAEATAARDKFWAERTGSNPDIRVGQSSRYADMQRAQRAGNLPDPIMLTEAERRSATRAAIRQDMAEAEK